MVFICTWIFYCSAYRPFATSLGTLHANFLDKKNSELGNFQQCESALRTENLRVNWFLTENLRNRAWTMSPRLDATTIILAAVTLLPVWDELAEVVGKGVVTTFWWSSLCT